MGAATSVYASAYFGRGLTWCCVSLCEVAGGTSARYGWRAASRRPPRVGEEETRVQSSQWRVGVQSGFAGASAQRSDS
jgi:hypothetical protein